jgi:hypothetical protein
MSASSVKASRSQRQLAALALVCGGLILAIKLLRLLPAPARTWVLVGIAPSALGAAAVFFLLASMSGRLNRMTTFRLALLATAAALAMEFLQLLPRPGILARVHYTFDWLDVAASVAGVGAGYLLALLLARREAGGG